MWKHTIITRAIKAFESENDVKYDNHRSGRPREAVIDTKTEELINEDSGISEERIK